MLSSRRVSQREPTKHEKRKKNPFVTELQKIQHAESNRSRLRIGLLNREWHFDTVPEEKR